MKPTRTPALQGGEHVRRSSWLDCTAHCPPDSGLRTSICSASPPPSVLR